MKLSILLIVIFLVTAGCEKTTPSPKGVSSPFFTGNVEELISGWGNMGAWLPDHDQIAYFVINFKTAEAPLSKALSNENNDVRERAAYVISELGDIAHSTGPAVLSQLKVEKERLVRMRLVNALNKIHYDTKDTMMFLKELFEKLDSKNVPPVDNSYAEVDEKIYVSSSLYSLTHDHSKEKYLLFVANWLKPPSKELSPELLEGYWERRLNAVQCLEDMPGAIDAIQLLEALLKEKGAKPLVLIHVPKVLDSLRGSSK